MYLLVPPGGQAVKQPKPMRFHPLGRCQVSTKPATQIHAGVHHLDTRELAEISASQLQSPSLKAGDQVEVKSPCLRQEKASRRSGSTSLSSESEQCLRMFEGKSNPNVDMSQNCQWAGFLGIAPPFQTAPLVLTFGPLVGLWFPALSHVA